MPGATSDKSLDSEQCKLLIEVINRCQPKLKSHDWDDIASHVGATNGKAARERFRYLMASLNSTSATTPKTPKSPSKSPATRISRATLTLPKKRKSVQKGIPSDPMKRRKSSTAAIGKLQQKEQSAEKEPDEEDEEEELSVEARDTKPVEDSIDYRTLGVLGNGIFVNEGMPYVSDIGDVDFHDMFDSVKE